MKRIQFFDQSTVKKERKRVAVDEKELTINDTTIFIWGAVDLDDEKVITVWVSLGRSGLVSCQHSISWMKSR
jgi:transposase-like protein